MKCSNCSTEIPPGRAQCPKCRQYHLNLQSPEEETRAGLPKIIPLWEVSSAEEDRLVTGPWDKSLGGGIVRTSTLLLGGPPGAGKSTLMLEIAKRVPGRTLYLATEEECGQIRGRADRLGCTRTELERIHAVPLEGGSDLDALLELAGNGYALAILDSLPGLCGDDQQHALNVCVSMKRYATRNGCPGILLDHVTKEDSFAGRMTLQHHVDVLLTFLLDDEERVFRAEKNRHGPAFVETRFEMNENGLEEIPEEDEE
jgi:DNA repair protein RadA/Sms